MEDVHHLDVREVLQAGAGVMGEPRGVELDDGLDVAPVVVDGLAPSAAHGSDGFDVDVHPASSVLWSAFCVAQRRSKSARMGAAMADA